MISGLYQGGRYELAQTLARRTGWPVLSREELHEMAREQGIRVGRLEVSMIKRPSLSEKLAREKNLFLAFVTATLCERALEANLIYCGRAGHLLLPGVNHRLRVGLTAPLDIRVQRTAKALSMQPDQAESYLAQLDDDVQKWIRYVHHTDGYHPNQLDVFFNLEKMSVPHAAETLQNLAQLPEYQSTAVSTRLLRDLHLAAQAELRLILDEHTGNAELKVHAENGVVTVTYPPHQDAVSKHIPQVLADLAGCREIQCTMAETNILWIQERFNPESDNFGQILQLAQRWGAAVELMRLISSEEMSEDGQTPEQAFEPAFGRRESPTVYDGGVEDDDPVSPVNDGGMGATMEELINRGRAGGGRAVCGDYNKILERVRGDAKYALVVVGDMFLSKGRSIRTRRTRELAMSVREKLKAPVITAEELKSRFLFGKRQALALSGFAVLVALLYTLIFTHQDKVLSFLSGPGHEQIKWLAPLIVVLFIPVIAYLYGTVTGLALKLINID
jgi:cytidylate kinase